jgi:hemerythrin-like metal-binding protein
LKVAKDTAETASRVRDEILANMNHEVRTPLNSIIGFSDLLLADDQGYADHPSVRSYLEYIHQSGHHLLELLTDVLEMANIATNHLDLAEQSFDVAGTIRAVANLVRSQVVRAELRMETEIPSLPLILYADQRRVKQMLNHLLSNAVKFNRPGGMIRLSVSENDQGEIIFSVTDNGIGMDMLRISHAQSPFGKLGAALNNNVGGAGLGLSLTKGTIERHGGALSIVSKPGVGTTVTLRFPSTRTLQEDQGPAQMPATLDIIAVQEGPRLAIRWHDGMVIDRGAIDEDHKNLISLANQIDGALSCTNKERVFNLLKKLQYYTADHFFREEALQLEIGFPGIDDHAKEHRLLVSAIEKALGLCSQEFTDEKCKHLADNFVPLMNVWIVDHIMKRDLPMRTYVWMHRQGLSAEPISGLPN